LSCRAGGRESNITRNSAASTGTCTWTRWDPLPEEPSGPTSATDPDEAAWRTAVEAAPWLVGESDPHAKSSPEELYETLKPFKDKVAQDIKENKPEQE
jgi:hypothetical protein